MTYRHASIAAVFILTAALAFGSEGAPGSLEILESPSAGPGAWDLTTIRFAVQGPYSGRIEFFQHKTIKYVLKVQVGAGPRAEYQVSIPSPMDQIPYKVKTDTMTVETDARLIEYVRGHTSGPSGIFGTVVPSGSMKVKAILIAVLYVVCVSQLFRLKPAGRRAVAAAIATIAFSAAELTLVRNRVEESSVTLCEGKAGLGSCSYELVGLGAPWGGRGTVKRDRGVLFPVYPRDTDLWSSSIEIALVGEGSSAEGLELERGKRRVFCCISPGGLVGEVKTEGGDVVNATGLDMRAYLFRGGRLLDLGRLAAGAKARPADAAQVSKSDLLGEAQKFMLPAATALLDWRARYLESRETVIGLVPPDRLIFFEMSDAGTE